MKNIFYFKKLFVLAQKGAFAYFLKSSAIFLIIAIFVFFPAISFLPAIVDKNQLIESIQIKKALAAITYQSAGAIAYSTQGGSSVAPAYPASITANNLLVVLVGMKPSIANGGSVTTPSGWTPIASLTGAGGYGTTLGADTGNTNVFAYYKVAAGGESGSLAITIATNNISWGQMYRLSAGAGSTWNIAGTTGSDTVGNSAVSITHTSNPNVTAGDHIIGAMVIPTDRSTPAQFSAEALSQAGITFNTVTEISEPDSSIGNDIGGVTYRGSVNSGTAVGNPLFTATAGGVVTNVRGPGIFIRIREIPPSGYPASGDVVSSTFDTNAANGVTYNSILWKGTKPLGTKVRLQLASSDSSTGPFTFIGGATCTSGDYYDMDSDQSADIKCFSFLNNKRYFRYKAILCSSSDCTSSSSQTPQLNDVIINWSP